MITKLERTIIGVWGFVRCIQLYFAKNVHCQKVLMLHLSFCTLKENNKLKIRVTDLSILHLTEDVCAGQYYYIN